MVEKKKRRKGSITGQNIATLLNRYSPTTIISLIQEVAQVATEKLDWNELVKNSSTGISNAREYQMLWRHLAYQDPISGELEEDAKPLDDDSDLEYESEAYPPISGEASIEATAVVKVLIASGLHGVSSLANGMTVEAPLTINIPTSVGVSEALQQQGINITIPVRVPKQPLNLPTVPSTEINGPTSSNLPPPKKKRKQWSEEEDTKLRAAVLRCGDGSWATILKEDFCGERTASQLAQRWSAIKKRQQGNVNVGGSSQLSEIHLAARRAVSLALDMPIDNLKPTSSNTVGITTGQQDNSGPVGLKKVQTATKGSMGAVEDPVKAAAVAAGARIASASDAASLLMAARGKSAVHMTSGSGLPPNVHFIRTGLLTSTNSLIHARPQVVVAQQSGSSSLKSANPTTNTAAAELLTNKTAGKASEENKPEDKTVENGFSNVKKEKEDEAVNPPANEILQTVETLKIGGDADMSSKNVDATNVQLEDGNKKLDENKKEDEPPAAAAAAIVDAESEVMVKDGEETHRSDQICEVETNKNVNDEERPSE